MMSIVRKTIFITVAVVLLFGVTAGAASATPAPQPGGTHREGMTKLTYPGHPSVLVDDFGFKIVITPKSVTGGVMTFLVCEGRSCHDEKQFYSGQGGAFWLGSYVFARCNYQSCRMGQVALYVYDCWQRTDKHSDSETYHQ